MFCPTDQVCRSIIYYNGFFKLAAFHHLGFVKIGNVIRQCDSEHEMRRYTKFREDRSNGCRDTAI